MLHTHDIISAAEIIGLNLAKSDEKVPQHIKDLISDYNQYICQKYGYNIDGHSSNYILFKCGQGYIYIDTNSLLFYLHTNTNPILDLQEDTVVFVTNSKITKFPLIETKHNLFKIVFENSIIDCNKICVSGSNGDIDNLSNFIILSVEDTSLNVENTLSLGKTKNTKILSSLINSININLSKTPNSVNKNICISTCRFENIKNIEFTVRFLENEKSILDHVSFRRITLKNLDKKLTIINTLCDLSELIQDLDYDPEFILFNSPYDYQPYLEYINYHGGYMADAIICNELINKKVYDILKIKKHNNTLSNVLSAINFGLRYKNGEEFHNLKSTLITGCKRTLQSLGVEGQLGGVVKIKDNKPNIDLSVIKSELSKLSKEDLKSLMDEFQIDKEIK